MKEGTRAQNCPKCGIEADINEFEHAQCPKSKSPDCDISWYLPVAQWNTKCRMYRMYHRDDE
jgi:hypothetical protein